MTVQFIRLILICISVITLQYRSLNAQGQSKSISKLGVECIYKKTSNQTTALRIIYRGGYSEDPENKEGLSSVLLEVLFKSGLMNMDTLVFREKLKQLEIDLNWDIQPDFTAIQVECPSEQTEAALQLITQWLISPGWDAKIFKQIIDARVSALDHEVQDVQAQAEYRARKNFLRNTGYGREAMGSSSVISGFTLNEMKAYYKNHFVKTALLLTLVSPLSHEEIERWVVDPFTRIPLGLYAQTQAPVLKSFEKPGFQSVPDSGGMPLLTGYCAVPALSRAEGLCVFFVSSLIDQKLKREIRIKRGMEAEVRCSFHFLRSPVLSLYIEGIEIKNISLIVKNTLEQMAKENMQAEEIRQHRERLLTVLYTDLQENMNYASFLGTWAICAGKDREAQLMQELSAISPEMIRNCMLKYIRNFQWTFIGLPSLLKPEDIKLQY